MVNSISVCLLVYWVHPPSQKATVSRPWKNAGVLRSLGEGGLELRRVTPYRRCQGLLPVGLHYSCYFNKAIISSFIENMDYSKDRISNPTDKIKSSIENVKG
jgi:hypothetical protein